MGVLGGVLDHSVDFWLGVDPQIGNLGKVVFDYLIVKSMEEVKKQILSVKGDTHTPKNPYFILHQKYVKEK